MPPADSASRAGGMPKASRDRSLGTFANKMTPTAREIRFRSEYIQMMAAPRLLPDSGVTDMTRYHLYHLARYLSRLKGFITGTGHGLQHFLDTDLGACLLAAAFTIDKHMRSTGDTLLTTMWDQFSTATDLFRSGDNKIVINDLESSFDAMCMHCHFDPWKK